MDLVYYHKPPFTFLQISPPACTAGGADLKPAAWCCIDQPAVIAMVLTPVTGPFYLHQHQHNRSGPRICTLQVKGYAENGKQHFQENYVICDK